MYKYVYDNGEQVKVHYYNVGKDTSSIAEARNGKSQRLVAETLGVPKSTVGDIWKEREKIKAHAVFHLEVFARGGITVCSKF